MAQTTSQDESAAITKTALDYIEGWYAGDAARMKRALHPELAKRMTSIDPKTGLFSLFRIKFTRRGGQSETPNSPILSPKKP